MTCSGLVDGVDRFLDEHEASDRSAAGLARAQSARRLAVAVGEAPAYALPGLRSRLPICCESSRRNSGGHCPRCGGRVSARGEPQSAPPLGSAGGARGLPLPREPPRVRSGRGVWAERRRLRPWVGGAVRGRGGSRRVVPAAHDRLLPSAYACSRSVADVQGAALARQQFVGLVRHRVVEPRGDSVEPPLWRLRSRGSRRHRGRSSCRGCCGTCRRGTASRRTPAHS
jgi:hypothetical protein